MSLINCSDFKLNLLKLKQFGHRSGIALLLCPSCKNNLVCLRTLSFQVQTELRLCLLSVHLERRKNRFRGNM